MKQASLIFLFSLLTFFSRAVETDGYYVSQAGDTVSVKINLPKFLGEVNSASFPKIETRDTVTNLKQVFRPADIKAFGFVYKNKVHDFVTRNFDDKPGFYEKRRMGTKLNLYSTLISSGGGQYSYTAIECIIEKPDGSFVTLPGTESSKKTKNKLKGFFTEPDILQVIEGSFNDRNDLEKDSIKFVDGVNGK